MKNTSLIQTLLSHLHNCKSISQLNQIHGLLLPLGLHHQHFFASKILSFDFGNVDYSFRFLSQLSSPTTFHWNLVIRGYSHSKNPNRSFSVYLQMLRNGTTPDQFTYLFLAKASTSLLNPELGKAVHACTEKHGDMGSAREMFELMPERDVVSWSSLIDGYVKAGEYTEALALFERMQIAGYKANEVTMVSILCACAHLGALEQGRLMHNYIVDNRLPLTLVLRTSLVDMYSKCGAIEEALVVFRGGLMRYTDVLIWNAMIGGLATHGLVKEALNLFKEMQMIRVVPDEITYLCLLSACAHGGLVKEAWYLFECLKKNGMIPKSEHYACMVDILARAGHVAEAFEFIFQMPIEPTAAMLGALLSGCIKHGKLDLAQIIGRKLIEIEPDRDSRYISLSNVYALSKSWDDAGSMRESMERRGVKKSPGFSFV